MITLLAVLPGSTGVERERVRIGGGHVGGHREPEAAASDRAYSWLRAGIPLTLLMDLASPYGPDSTDLARREGPPPLPWWFPTPREASASSPEAGPDRS